jgi:hypothetical protein
MGALGTGAPPRPSRPHGTGSGKYARKPGARAEGRREPRREGGKQLAPPTAEAVAAYLEFTSGQHAPVRWRLGARNSPGPAHVKTRRGQAASTPTAEAVAAYLEFTSGQHAPDRWRLGARNFPGSGARRTTPQQSGISPEQARPPLRPCGRRALGLRAWSATTGAGDSDLRPSRPHDERSTPREMGGRWEGRHSPDRFAESARTRPPNWGAGLGVTHLASTSGNRSGPEE